MILTEPSAFVAVLNDLHRQPTRRVCPATMRAALLVTPVGFRVSEQSAMDNLYMQVGQSIDPERAMAQHQGVARLLMSLGVPTLQFPGREGLDDAVFPNNAFATVPGRLIVGAMSHPVRIRETEREDIPALFQETFGYELINLSTRGCVAELTGVMALDRQRGVGFCGMTQRVDDLGVAAMYDAFDLRLSYRFDLSPTEYHLNLVLSVLAGRACVIHPPSFLDPEVPQSIMAAYPERTLVINDEEKAAFVGNCIAVTEEDVVFSNTSIKALRPESRQTLERWGFRVHGVDVDELEKGGGSLRCLIAEVF